MLAARALSSRESEQNPARPLPPERVFCRSRFLRGTAGVLLALAILLGGFAPAVAAQQATPVPADAVQRAADWLMSQRTPEGAFLGFDGNPDVGTTVDGVLALAAARDAGATVDLAPSVAFLEQGALVYAQTGAGQAAKLTLAIVATGGDPRNFAAVDPLSLIERSADPETGIYGLTLFDHALVILAMTAAGATVPEAAIDELTSAQLDNYSWSWDPAISGDAGDTNTTAIAIQALAAVGLGERRVVDRALEYLKSVQLGDGGFPYQGGAGAVSDANSTGIVVMALIAAGQDPASADWDNVAGTLLAMQNESGAFRYSNDPPDDNLYATLQALQAIALLGSGGGATPVAS